MNRTTKKTTRCAVIILFFWLTACVAKPPPKHDNFYLGYVYCKAVETYDKKADRQTLQTLRQQGKEYEQSIASAELKKRMAKKPEAAVQQLDSWSNYVEELKCPVIITERQCLTGSQAVKEKESGWIREYWQGNRDGLVLDGKAVSGEWGRELKDAELYLGSLKAGQGQAMQRLNDCLQKKEYDTALDLLPELQSYGDISAFKDGVREKAVSYWVGSVKDELEKAKTLALTPREDLLASLFVKIGQYTQKSGRADRFSQVLQETAEALGATWQKQIISLGEERQYWKAHELLLKKVQLLNLYTPYGDSLLQSMGIGYNQILSGAMQYYADLANSRLSEDLYGCAYIFSCMAAQMYDACDLPRILSPAVTRDINRSAEAQQWRKNHADLVADIEKSIQRLLSRRLIIHDFESDSRQMAGKIRKECLRRYGRPGNDLAWALSVTEGDPGTAEKAQASGLDEQDFSISGVVSHYAVEQVMDKTTTQGVLQVGSEIINKIPNPNYDIEGLPFSDSRTVWSQQVLLYPWRKIERRKKVSVDIQATCDRAGGKSLELYSLKKEFRDNELKSTIHTEDIVYDNLQLLPQLKLDLDRSKLPVQSRPANTQTPLSDDIQIYNEVDGIVISNFLAALDNLVVQYPIELLAGGGQGGIRPDETPDGKCNRLGIVLMYCNKLSEGGLETNYLSGKEFQWIHRQSQITLNIDKWSSERWPKPSNSILKGPDGISNLWKKCYSAALLLEEKQ